MTILTLILLFVCVGLIMWLVNKYVPMPDGLKTALNVLVVVILVIIVIEEVGLLGPLNTPIRMLH